MPWTVLSTLITLIVFHQVGFSAADIVKLPTIDKQDIRFIPVSIDGALVRFGITGIVRDNYGFLWVAGQGLYRYDGYSLKRYRHDVRNPNSLSDDTVKVIYRDQAGMLWIGTGFGGLDRLDPADETFTHYRHDPRDDRTLSDDTINSIYQDRQGTIWVGTNGGLDRFDPVNKTFTHYREGSNLAGPVFEDRNGNLWVGMAAGLRKLDRPTGRFVLPVSGTDKADRTLNDLSGICCIHEDRSGVLWLASLEGLIALHLNTRRVIRYSPEESSRLISIHEGQDGELWLGTLGNGLLRLNRERTEFIRYRNEPANPNSLPGNVISALSEDQEGLIWVGAGSGLSRFPRKPLPFVSLRNETKKPSILDSPVTAVQVDSESIVWIAGSGQLNRLDRTTGLLTNFSPKPAGHESISSGSVSAMIGDRSGALWFGTFDAGLNRFDRATGRFSAFRHDSKKPDSLSHDCVLSLLVDRQGILWVGTQRGLNRFDARTESFAAYRHDPRDPHSLSDDHVKTILEDRSGQLWLGTNAGLNRFDPTTRQSTAYHHNPQDTTSLSHSQVNAIQEDRRGTLWIGTTSGLNHFNAKLGTFTRFTQEDGLPDNIVSAILEDDRGYLWLATRNGLSRFHPEDRTFRNYSESDGLPSNVMSSGSFRTRNGEMFFGSASGLFSFHPGRISDNAYLPRIALTDFLLSNAPVRPGVNSLLQKPIWATDSVTLTPDQRVFAIDFAALSYLAPERNRYRYRLEGFDTHWSEGDSRIRRATYNSLPPGSYVFRVQGSNNDGLWNEQGASLTIRVLPPWWATWQFRSAVVLCSAALVLGVHRLRVRTLRATAAKLQAEVSERTRELQTAKDAADTANRAKSAFLANISHELRTPLNAILGFTGMVLKDHSLPEKHRKDLAIVGKSGEHLLGLIDEVLDIAKIETGNTAVQMTAIDLHGLVNDTVNMLRERAQAKNLELLVDISPRAPRFVRSDPAKLRQVLTNLTGNALKFTDDGSVVIRLDAKPGGSPEEFVLVFDVEDTGVGIAPEDQLRIFDPFVQAGRIGTTKGTGLGLSISRHFLQLLGGTIQVESVPGQGSRFHVEVPAQVADASQVNAQAGDMSEVICLEPGQPDYRILIVEDKRENWLLLQRLLQTAGFQVRVAEDGGQGVETFRMWRPHFIWMDLRLPVLGGMEVVRQIRELDGGREVRIAAVTASAFGSERENVIASGFDDFLRKPYRSSEIFACMAVHLGVRYTKSHTAFSTVSDLPGTLHPEDLLALPAALREDLESAIMSLDPARIALAINRIFEQNASLGRVLECFSEKLAYSPILRALQRVKSDVNSAGACQS